MPRLRPSLRILDASRPDAVLSVVRGRRPAETAVGLRRANLDTRKIVFRSAGRRLRQLRRPARSRLLLRALIKPRRTRSHGGNHEKELIGFLRAFVTSWLHLDERQRTN